MEGPNLYPQDRLVEVNGENVEGASNDRIYELFEVLIHSRIVKFIEFNHGRIFRGVWGGGGGGVRFKFPHPMVG